MTTGGELPAPAQPDAENVPEVAQVATEQFQPAVAIVVPADGRLLDAVTQAARDHQNFYVEHVTVDALPGKDFAGCGAGEEFEAALRVGDACQANDSVHEHTEGSSSKLPVQRLAFLDVGTAHVARADHHLEALVEPGPDVIEFLYRDLVICIRITNDFPVRESHGLAHAAAFAQALAITDDAHRLALAGRFEGLFAGAVVSVRRDYDLVAETARLEILRCLADGRGYGAGFIERRQD